MIFFLLVTERVWRNEIIFMAELIGRKKLEQWSAKSKRLLSISYYLTPNLSTTNQENEFQNFRFPNARPEETEISNPFKVFYM